MNAQAGFRSFGLRDALSRVMAADRSSRWLGQKFEESLVKQAIGNLLACADRVMPQRVVMLAAPAELEIITRSGLCGTLTSAFRGSLELRELSYPVLRDFLAEHSTAGPVMVIAIGTEKKPQGWPLPDFSKWAGAKPSREQPAAGLSFAMAGRWLRLDRRGNPALLEKRSIERDEAKVSEAPPRQGGGKDPATFEFSWGIWSALRRSGPDVENEASGLLFQALSLGSGSAARVVLPPLSRQRLGEFMAGAGMVYLSTPTLECSQWLLSEAGFAASVPDNVRMIEHSCGWGPSFSLLRFYADANPGDRMVVLRDLQSVDLIQAGTRPGGGN